MKITQRVGNYLAKYADTLVFDQFQESYLEREHLQDFMKNVPVPMSTENVVEFHKKQGLDVMQVAQNMIRIIGINPEFPYGEQYLRYIRTYFDQNIAEAVVRDGEQRAQKGQMEEALIYFRAALILNPRQKYGLFDYGLACRQLSEAEEEDDAYRGAMKAESIEAFEELSSLYPDFAPTYYYLGYIYLNMGLYTKAKLTFELFLRLSEKETTDSETVKAQREEIAQRVEQLAEPAKIEGGINHILAGRWDTGLRILERYVGGAYDSWWPMHYYMGTAYMGTGQTDKAVQRFQRVLQLHPSHAETMEELAEIYAAKGDAAMSEKYRKKIELVKER